MTQEEQLATATTDLYNEFTADCKTPEELRVASITYAIHCAKTGIQAGDSIAWAKARRILIGLTTLALIIGVAIGGAL